MESISYDKAKRYVKNFDDARQQNSGPAAHNIATTHYRYYPEQMLGFVQTLYAEIESGERKSQLNAHEKWVIVFYPMLQYLAQEDGTTKAQLESCMSIAIETTDEETGATMVHSAFHQPSFYIQRPISKAIDVAKLPYGDMAYGFPVDDNI